MPDAWVRWHMPSIPWLISLLYAFNILKTSCSDAVVCSLGVRAAGRVKARTS